MRAWIIQSAHAAVWFAAGAAAAPLAESALILATIALLVLAVAAWVLARRNLPEATK